MTISQVFKKMADKRLAEHGFKRRRIEGVIWVYERVHDGMKQSLIFQNHGVGLKHLIPNQPPCMELGIGAHPNPNFEYISGHRLTYLFSIDYIKAYLPSLANRLVETNGYYCAYKSFEELEEVISDYIDFTIEKAMHIFPALAKSNRWELPEMKEKLVALQQKLIENTQQYADNFTKKYNLSYITNISFVKERIKHIEELFLKNKDKDIDEIEELFLTSAAYLGELVIRTHGGRWGWKQFYDREVYLIIDIPIPNNTCFAGQKSDELHIFSSMAAGYWDNPEIYFRSITSSYKRLLQSLGLEEYYS